MAPGENDKARRAWKTMTRMVLDDDRKTAVSEALDLSFARVRAIRRLAPEPLTMRALAEALKADPPYVTLMVDDLEERGLVERNPHPADRRAKLVSLTPAGQKAATEAERILNYPPAGFIDLTPGELDSLLGLLEKVSPEGD